MRSALAGTASNVVALKTTAAVPMSVIERMVHLLCGAANNDARSHGVPRKPYLIAQNIFGSLRNILKARRKVAADLKDVVKQSTRVPSSRISAVNGPWRITSPPNAFSCRQCHVTQATAKRERGHRMKMLAEYLENPIRFEQMAAEEKDATLKAQFEKQAFAYRKLAEKRAKDFGLKAPRD
jgi:uncharacterized protein (DUF2384 family)